MNTSIIKTPNQPNQYIYRGKTITNNGEKSTTVKYSVFEGLLRGCNLEQDKAFLNEIKPYFDQFKSNSKYTVDDYLEVLDRACDWLFPNLTREQGREEIGKLTFEGFRKTIFGRVALAALHLMKPERAIKLAGTLFGETGSGSWSTKAKSKNCFVLSARKVSGTPEDQKGVLEAGLPVTGASNLRIKLERLTLADWDFIIEWD